MRFASSIKYILGFCTAFSTLAAADICQTLKQQNENVDYAASIQYETEINHYWSAACSDLRPSCMLFPSSAEQVADIVRALQDTDDFFAVKSGGHMPNNGFASIQNGVLISTKNLNQVVYDPDTQTAVIGPGLAWEDAQKGLDGTGRTLVGGRIGGVGVGGYLLGGESLAIQSWGHSCLGSNIPDRWLEFPQFPIRLGGEQRR